MSTVYIFPISGPFFPLQMASLIEWQKAVGDVVPNIALGSSGGALVANFGSGSSWKYSEILSKIPTFNSNEIFTSPSPIAPGFFNWLFTGSLLTVSPSIDSIYKRIVTKISQTELIIGTYCKTDRRCALFSNKTKETSYFSSEDISIFTNNDQRLTLSAMLASAAIPEILAPVRIGEKFYQDGGLYSPSPWSSLWSKMPSSASKFVYFISTTVTRSQRIGIVDTIITTLASTAQREITDAIEYFKTTCTVPPTHFITSNSTEAATKFKLASKALVTIRPVYMNYHFDMTSFIGDDILRIIEQNKCLQYDVFYA